MNMMRTIILSQGTTATTPSSLRGLTDLKCILFALIPAFWYLSLPYFSGHSSYAQCTIITIYVHGNTFLCALEQNQIWCPLAEASPGVGMACLTWYHCWFIAWVEAQPLLLNTPLHLSDCFASLLRRWL